VHKGRRPWNAGEFDQPPGLRKRNPGVIALSLSGFHTQISITPVLHLSEGPPQTAMNLMVY